MKEYIKAIPVTTLIILYLYLCGGLYLIAFWSTFKFDISNIVSVVDIPKSFIFPFILGNGFFIVQLVVSSITQKKVYEQPFDHKRHTRQQIILDFLLLVVFGLITSFYLYYEYSLIYWGLSCAALVILLSFKFESNSAIKRVLPSYNLRYYVSTVLIVMPIFCVLTAKGLSLAIYNNSSVRYIKVKNVNELVNISDSSALKLIGFLGDKIIVSSLNNKQIIVLNQSTFSIVELNQKEKK